MLESTWTALKHHQRGREIVTILASFGAQDVLFRLGLGRLVGGAEPVGSQPTDEGTPQRVRRALEALGPTFVKLGQILASRGDILPALWIEELENLHSGAATLTWEQLQGQVLEDLGAELDQVFAEFNTTPLAAASIAQVYRARLLSGEDVVVKIQRPGLRRKMTADLQLLESVALLIEDNGALAQYQPRKMVRQLARAMLEELDFTQEGLNCDAVAANFSQQPHIVIPRIYWAHSSERLLVQEYLPSYTPLERQALIEQGLDPSLLASRGARAFIKMLLEDGVFHGDPHPGNLKAMSGNRVGFIDFGMVGRLDERRRLEVMSFMRALTENNSDALVTVLIDWSGNGVQNIPAIEQAAREYIARHGGKALNMSALIEDFLDLMREHQLLLPPDLLVLFKALVTADGVLTRLDPELDLIATAKPAIVKMLREQLSWRMTKRLGLDGLELGRGLLGDLPQLARLLVNRLKHGVLEVRMDLPGLERLERSLRLASTRLSLALLISALVITFGPQIAAVGPVWAGLPILSWLAAIATAGGLVAFLWSLFKSS
ncbi:TPA: AarF/ABC1/UbiB kinase family protein [Pseudomonas aeruginosa]|uniref:ABC1 kinase family protein n=1 Tax=Pseudomonas TaxID=286 RepID=UPI0009971A02|nr:MULTISPECIES: AarF/UbiB family protein [Pseudomonas]HBO7968047.1 AarF/ABC1/UbiB kinase family protein [Pseudomonas aeruginosa]MBJ2204537.1 AarF/ABC1/UbiB kinase family protein [Pseudomonas carnis]MBK3468653.1 AarF/ABC1/UbiB kinase family protein [Pseudomonas sp. MF6776]MBW9241447.1 AarF/ABC1/UbiB kinase family protein [Pseudomonas carnis]MDH0797858.1 AarF/UbiB family protein [Pseudomonas carnis]